MDTEQIFSGSNFIIYTSSNFPGLRLNYCLKIIKISWPLKPTMSCTFWVKLDSDFNTTSSDIFVFKMGTSLNTELTSNVGDRA